MSSLTLPPEEKEADRKAWLEHCSTAQLKEIVAIGVAAGDRFDLAVGELERRSSESRHRVEERDEELARQTAKRDRTLLIVAAIAAFILVFVLTIEL